MKSGIAAAWAAGIAIVAWREIHNSHRLPVPGALLGISLLFAGGAVIADIWPNASKLVVLGLAGLDVAALLNTFPRGLGTQLHEADAATTGAEYNRAEQAGSQAARAAG